MNEERTHDNTSAIDDELILPERPDPEFRFGKLSILFGSSPTPEQLRLLELLKVERTVFEGMGYPPDFRDFFQMDPRRIAAATEAARDISQVRIAAILALLITYGAEVNRG